METTLDLLCLWSLQSYASFAPNAYDEIQDTQQLSV